MGKANITTLAELTDEAERFARNCQCHATQVAYVRDELAEIRASGKRVLTALQDRRRQGKATAISVGSYTVDIDPGKRQVCPKAGTSEDEVIAWLERNGFGKTCVKRAPALNVQALEALLENDPDSFYAAGLRVCAADWLSVTENGHPVKVYGKAR